MSDIPSILLGLCLYFLLFLPTSYAICWLARPFDFRSRSAFFRLCVAQALAFAVTPYLLYVLYRVATPWLILLPALVGLIPLVYTLRRLRWRHAKPALLLLLLVTCLALAVIPELTIGTRTYLSGTAQDYAKHIAVTHTLTVDRVPPANPSFAPGHPLPLFYYYFWFLTSSTVEIVSKGVVSAHNAVIAGVIFNTFSLLATVVLSAWLLLPGPRRRNRSHVYLALCLLLVSGVDLIPYSITVIHNLLAGQTFLAAFPGSVEWWNEQVTNWAATALWVPHHTAAFLVLWVLYWEAALPWQRQFCLRSTPSQLDPTWPLLLFRAAALVSIFGMSVWLGLVGAAIFGLWTLREILQRNWTTVKAWLSTEATAAILALPFVLDLMHAKHSSARVVAFSVRRFFPIEVFFDRIDALANTHGVSGFALKLLHQTIFLLCLPLNYGMELGVFALAAFLYWRYCRETSYALRGGSAWWQLLLPCGLAVTFVRAAIANNDLGWRVFLPLQMALLLVLVMVWDRLHEARETRWRPFAVALAAIGLATTVTDVALMRLQPIAADRTSKTSPASLTYSRRQAYLRLNASVDPSLYVQHNPKREVDYESGLFSDRKLVLSDATYGALYSVDANTLQTTFDHLNPVFQSCEAGAEQYATAIADDYHIAYWMFQSTDPIWTNRQCWIWSRPAFYSDAYVLVIPANPQN